MTDGRMVKGMVNAAGDKTCGDIYGSTVITYLYICKYIRIVIYICVSMQT